MKLSLTAAAILITISTAAYANRATECAGGGNKFSVIVDQQDSLVSLTVTLNQSEGVFHSGRQVPIPARKAGSFLIFRFRSEISGSGTSSAVILQIPQSLKGSGKLADSSISGGPISLDCK